jgi:hypothetical protein
MPFRNLVVVNAIVFLAFGVGFVLIPAPLLSLYGISPQPGAMVVAQGYGGLFIAIGLLSWLSRKLTDVPALKAIQLSFMIAFAINTVVSILGTVTGGMNALGWSAVIIYLFLSVDYAYFYFTTPRGQDV